MRTAKQHTHRSVPGYGSHLWHSHGLIKHPADRFVAQVMEANTFKAVFPPQPLPGQPHGITRHWEYVLILFCTVLDSFGCSF
jgi:hypothetical protein